MVPAIRLQLWRATLGVFVSLGFALSHIALSQATAVQPASPANSSPVERTDATEPSASITFAPLSPSCPLPPIPLSDEAASKMAVFSYFRELFAFALEQGQSPLLNDVFQQLNTAEQYQKQGQSDAAAAVLDRALATYRNEEGTAAMAVAPPRLANTTRLWALTKFMELYAASGRAEQAVPLVDELVVFTQSLPRQDDISLRALVGAADVYRTMEQNNQANSVLTYVIQSTDAVEEPFVKAIILSEVTKVYVNLNDSSRAAEVLLQAQEFANAANGVSQKNAGTVALIPSYLALGQHENASHLADTIEPLELRQQIQQAISCAQANPSQ